MNTTTTTFQIITNLDDTHSFAIEQDGETVDMCTTTAWIVPTGTSLEDAPNEAETSFGIEANDNENAWLDDLRHWLAAEGYTLVGNPATDGSVFTADVAKI